MPTVCIFYGIIIQAELLTDWDLCRQHQQPNPIDPLK